MANQALEKLKRSGDIQTLLPDNDRYTNRFEIKSESSNRLYVVAQNKKTGEWSCSCPGWLIMRNGIRRCKHITQLTPLLAEVGKKPEMKKLNAGAEIEIDVDDPFFPKAQSQKSINWAKVWATELNGREYGNELTDAEEKEIKKKGLVVVYGYSDDNIEFRGAIREEIGCFDGGEIYFNKTGSNFTDENGEAPLTYMKDKSKPEKNMIEAVWCPKRDDGCSWIYKTKIPHETFKIMEDKELFCIGIVFNIKDLK